MLRDKDTDELSWVENGNLGFVLHAPIGMTQGDFVVGDIDGDGDSDVVAIDPSNNGLVTLLNPRL